MNKGAAAAQRDAQVKQAKQNIWHISCTAPIMRTSVKYCILGLFSKSNKCVRQSKLQPLSVSKCPGSNVTENTLVNFQPDGFWSDQTTQLSAIRPPQHLGGEEEAGGPVFNWMTAPPPLESIKLSNQYIVQPRRLIVLRCASWREPTMQIYSQLLLLLLSHELPQSWPVWLTSPTGRSTDSVSSFQLQGCLLWENLSLQLHDLHV